MVSCSKTHCGLVRPISLLAMKSKKSFDRFRKVFPISRPIPEAAVERRLTGLGRRSIVP
jgi:hypothetical protein